MDQAQVLTALISQVSEKHHLTGHDARDFYDNARQMAVRPSSAASILDYFERMDEKAKAKHQRLVTALKDFQIQHTNLKKFEKGGKRRSQMTVSA